MSELRDSLEEEGPLSFEDVEDQLRAAFPLEPVPEVVATGAGDAEPLIETITGRHWTELNEEDLDAGPNMAVMTPEAYRYYLPGYLVCMLHWIRRTGENQFALPPFLLQPLTYIRGATDVQRELYGGFTDQQLRAIRSYVRLALQLRSPRSVPSWQLFWRDLTWHLDERINYEDGDDHE